MSSSEVTIVIPILNEADSLPELLKAISSQTRPPREAIFVDSGSTDGSADLIREFAQCSNVVVAFRVESNLGGLPGGNRNRGIQAAQCEWIAFLDAGIIPEPTWLERLVNWAETKQTKAVFGVCQFDAAAAFPKAVCAISYGCGAVHPVLPASLFHRSVFDSTGLFREDLRAAEDRLWLRGFEAAFGPRPVSSAAVVHYCHFPSSLPKLARKYWRYECDAVRSGVVGRGELWLSAAAMLAGLGGLIRFSQAGMILLFLLVIIRGVVVPIQRSQRSRWLKPPFAAVPMAIGLCFLRDAMKLLARCYSLLRLSIPTTR